MVVRGEVLLLLGGFDLLANPPLLLLGLLPLSTRNNAYAKDDDSDLAC